MQLGAVEAGVDSWNLTRTSIEAQLYKVHVESKNRPRDGSAPSAGKRCLELTDTPDTEPAFDPHFYYSPGHESGTTRVAFDVRLEAAHQFLVEWRDDAEPYHTGPMLMFQNGAVNIPGRKLMDMPADTWVRVAITAKLGEQSDGTWECTVTLPGKEPQVFSDLKFVSPAMKRLNWFGIISPGKAQSKGWLDEVVIENMPEEC